MRVTSLYNNVDQGWHFVGGKLRDGTPIPKTGVWLRHSGKLVMCESGLHYSRTPWEALRYAPGETICKVEVQDFVYQNDKGVAKARKIIAKKNIRELLYDFACKEALAVVPKDATKIVRDYLSEQDYAKRDLLRNVAWNAARDAAAGYAARYAAGNAARDAAGYAAGYNAAWNAAGNAAWNAARYAARDAAGYAAWNAARYAARYAARDAAGYAAGNAAWNAAKERQAKEFNTMIYEAFNA